MFVVCFCARLCCFVKESFVLLLFVYLFEGFFFGGGGVAGLELFILGEGVST